MRLSRRILVGALRVAFRALTDIQVTGRDNLPTRGPLIVVFNHIAHLDGPLVLSQMPFEVEGIALADLYRVPVTGQLLRLYGAIPVHRDQLDRSLLRQALAVVASGGVLALAPEARQSPTLALERGRTGAAYLALRSDAPILPIGIAGTETVYAAWRHLRRPRLNLSIGPVFRLKGPLQRGHGTRHAQLEAGRAEIMRRIAALLPRRYRGIYA